MSARGVGRAHRRLESIALMASTTSLGDVGTGRLLARLYESMAVPRPACADLYARFDGADLLLVACAMADALGLSAQQLRVLLAVHYARHGPTQLLVAQLGSAPVPHWCVPRTTASRCCSSR